MSFLSPFQLSQELEPVLSSPVHFLSYIGLDVPPEVAEQAPARSNRAKISFAVHIIYGVLKRLV